MESLKSLWNKVKEKLQSVGVEISEEYHPDVIFIETMAHRVHEIEVRLGIIAADQVPSASAEGAAVDIAAPGHAEVSNAATETKDPIVADPADIGSSLAKFPVETVWNGKRHVPVETKKAD